MDNKKLYSRKHAQLKVYGRLATIEEHYALSMRYKDGNNIRIPKTTEEVKGKTIEYFVVNGKVFDKSYLESYHTLLWVKYLDLNKDLIKYEDVLKIEKVNEHIDIIKKYITIGRKAILNEHKEFLTLLKHMVYVNETTGDLLKVKEDIYGHQTNCLGIMGGGIALNIRKLFPNVYKQYNKYCEDKNKSRALMGDCLVVNTNTGKMIANLFGQYGIGCRKTQTEYKYLKTALLKLKDYAKEKTIV